VDAEGIKYKDMAGCNPMMKTKNLKITTKPDDLQEGLFGQVFLFIFEVLPYLDECGVNPQWEIRSKLYGNADDDYIVVPGLLEPNNASCSADEKHDMISLNGLRDLVAVTIGNDWAYAFSLWNKFFKIPERIISIANGFPSLEGALGLHYRGTDKNKASDETNHVSVSDFNALADDFIGSHPGVEVIFIASDEINFVETFQRRYPDHRIVSSGEVVHHKDNATQDNMKKGEHAMLDCLLLSRCKYLLKCQSALSGFSKILNPDIEAYRVSANKLAFWNRDMPYFPDAHISKYTSKNPECQSILDRLFVDDWTDNKGVARRYSRRIAYDHKGRKRRFLGKISRLFLGRAVFRMET
jgi:hypothetical protein